MTTQQLRDELHAALGNRSDLGSDDTRYLRWLNWSLLDVCGMHKKRWYPPQRFHVLEAKGIFTISVVTGTCQAGADGSVTLAAADSQVDDYYNDMIVELTAYSGTEPDGLLNQKRVITDYATGTKVATIYPDWDVNPDSSTTYSIYRRYIDIGTDIGLSPVSSVWAIQRLEHLDDGAALTHGNWKDFIGKDITETGEPGGFARRGNMLIFDLTPNEDYSFRVWYYKFPTAFAAGSMTAECVLPVNWHEVVFKGAVYRGFEKLMEPERAEEARVSYIQSALERLSTAQLEVEQYQRGFKVKR